MKCYAKAVKSTVAYQFFLTGNPGAEGGGGGLCSIKSATEWKDLSKIRVYVNMVKIGIDYTHETCYI